jgi:hypothetical protein
MPALSRTVVKEHGDYRYRAFCTVAELQAAMSKMVEGISRYENFKNEVKSKQGEGRAQLYGDVWQVMYDAERRLRGGSSK